MPSNLDKDFLEEIDESSFNDRVKLLDQVTRLTELRELNQKDTHRLTILLGECRDDQAALINIVQEQGELLDKCVDLHNKLLRDRYLDLLVITIQSALLVYAAAHTFFGMHP